MLGVFAGTANVNGAPGFTFVAWVEDKAEPGAGVDTFRIQIFKNGFFYESAATAAAPSVLDKGGNIQVHKTN